MGFFSKLKSKWKHTIKEGKGKKIIKTVTYAAPGVAGFFGGPIGALIATGGATALRGATTVGDRSKKIQAAKKTAIAGGIATVATGVASLISTGGLSASGLDVLKTAFGTGTAATSAAVTATQQATTQAGKPSTPLQSPAAYERENAPSGAFDIQSLVGNLLTPENATGPDTRGGSGGGGGGSAEGGFGGTSGDFFRPGPPGTEMPMGAKIAIGAAVLGGVYLLAKAA